MISKSGRPLLEDRAVDALKKHVIARSAVLTPNYHELMRLTDKKYKNPTDAGRALLENYESLKTLLVKGGHIDEKGMNIIDTLLVKEGGTVKSYEFSHPRVKTVNTHGTGCTLSSAITAYLARGEKIKMAVELAVDYVFLLIKLAEKHKIGKGNGALPHYLKELS
jgi:hydroxymethylpyrimidine/phosphomethylpyrimidine kinase